jgi:hypothetical protein
MNKELRKAIYNKQMLRNKYEKYHTDKTWEAYRNSFKRRILSKSLTYASTSKFLKLL